MLTIESPFADQPGVVHLLEPDWADAEDLAEQLREERYGRPFVLEHDGLLSLYFSLHFEQSAMRRAAPDELLFGYTRAMMAFLLFQPRPARVLQIGLGGGALARACLRHLPAASLLALEIDPDVIAFRELFALPPDGPSFGIVQADAVAWLAEATAERRFAAREARFDVLLIDAFDRDGVASALDRLDFYEQARDCLSGRGVLVINLAGDPARIAAHAAHVLEAFDERVVVLPVREDGNQVLFAFRQPEFPPNWRSLAAPARALQQRTGWAFGEMLQALEWSARHARFERLL